MAQTIALFRKNWHCLLNTGVILRRQSRFKMVFVLLFAIGLESGLWALFTDGFRFLDSMGGAAALITGRLFSFFFLGMGAMLVISAAITSYATLYRSDEIPFLVSGPFPPGHIALYKFIETAGLSSWAFVFMIVPFVGAYAWHHKMPLLFPIWTVVFSIPLLFLCSALGTAMTMVVVRWVPRTRAFFLPAVLAGAGAAVWMLHRARGICSASPEDFRFALAGLVPGLSLASHPLMPSWWASEGIMSLSAGQFARGLRLLAVLATTAAVLCMLIEWLAGRIFMEGWLRVGSDIAAGRRRPILFPALEHFLPHMIPHDIRAMALKDLRTFFRDPMQWSQALIFFGLLGLYYANLRSFRYNTLPDTWRNTVAFLNVFSVAAVICSLASRFVYPQMSLEGQGFWILGLAPTSMERILMTKFVFSTLGLTVVSVALMALSSFMLEASPLVMAVAVGVAAAIAVATCGLSTGLGGFFMNIEQRNPAAIVSGFGGTLYLVASLGVMLAVIIPFGFVFHLRNFGRLSGGAFHSVLALCSLWTVLVALGAAIIPLKVAGKALTRREF